MARPFDYFVILAEMRTGSNFLEECLNEFPGLHCHGEVFNPHFIGHAKQTSLLGITLRQREAEPERLIEAMKAGTDGVPGFRLFSDHDPRIRAKCLADRRCAKIVLTRNPLESYVSREIARETGQWRLGDGKAARTASIRFDIAAFEDERSRRQAALLDLQHALQVSGQTAFFLDYEDISDVDVLNGLARFLGATGHSKAPSRRTKKQNPQPLAEKVSNYEEMQRALETLDPFGLERIPSFEPRRGPAVPVMIAAAHAPLLFVPVKCGPTDSVARWLCDLDGAQVDQLQTGFTQKTLRQWKRRNRGHRSFAVLRHPVARLHAAFVTHFLQPGPNRFAEIRTTLQQSYGLVLPEPGDDTAGDVAAHRQDFVKFAGFIRANLAGQTGVRVDPAWASQSEILRGVAEFMPVDHIFREAELASGLACLGAATGRPSPDFVPAPEAAPVPLAAIYDTEVEAAVKAAYQKDYMVFGFDSFAA